MLGFLSFLAFAFFIAFLVSLVLIVVRSVKKQPRKPFVILAAVSVVAVLGLSVPISQMYVPTEKPAAASETADVEQGESAPMSASVPVESENVDTVDKPVDKNAVSDESEIADEEQPAAPAPDPVEKSEEPKSEKKEKSEDAKSASDDPAVKDQDTELIRSLFDGLVSEYDGGVVSIDPRTINGEIYSWAIVDVVVPDSWYYLEDYQKERYCTNVGDYCRSAVISGGVAENEAGVAVHFFDVAGVEVAESKVFGGYKLK